MKNTTAMWFDPLSDEQMLLALCIREEELDEPAAWCADFRAYSRWVKEGPKSVAEAEAMMAKSEALALQLRSAKDG